HVVLIPRRMPASRRGLLAAQGSALPRKLDPTPTEQLGVVAGSLDRVHAVFEQGARGIRLREQQRRDREGFHVPHDMAVVVVIVVPLRETEDGRARGG